MWVSLRKRAARIEEPRGDDAAWTEHGEAEEGTSPDTGTRFGPTPDATAGGGSEAGAAAKDPPSRPDARSDARQTHSPHTRRTAT